ncbi:MAG: prepilin-type N-terminal cleavage/methylation domain-containing protein [Candidatus Omnitrophica bacterium]|jgi:prepilin-type N-terminal cleavage/methylation domain-containing protein|nr:prepilin-type N-terminal cleavage/methylation domain-containing protein [Candidatus Omnitrophota bacterium]
MDQRKKGFTLIELIIVVVIIGILALIAIPKYYSSIAKSRQSRVRKTLQIMANALQAYYAVNGVYPANGSWPIVVVVDGDTIYNVSNPTSTEGTSRYLYGYGAGTGGTCVLGDESVSMDYYKSGVWSCWFYWCLNKGPQGNDCTANKW